MIPVGGEQGKMEGRSQPGSRGEEKKARGIQKSLSLPDFSMNITYILRWLSRIKKHQPYEGEWGLRQINKNYYSEYSLYEISKNIKQRHSDPWILSQSFNQCGESDQ